MNIFRNLILSLICLACLGSQPVLKIKGEIFIRSSDGNITRLQNVPVFVLPKGEARDLLGTQKKDQFSEVNKKLNLLKPAVFTQANGEFTLNAPQSGYVLAVLAKEKIAGDEAGFFWLIDIDNCSRAQKFSLNNENLTADFLTEEQF